MSPSPLTQIAPKAQIRTAVDNLPEAIKAVESDIALSPAQITFDAATLSQAAAPSQAAAKQGTTSPEEAEAGQSDAAEISASQQAVQLAKAMAALANSGTTTDPISSGNSVKDMAESVEFQDPFNPSDNPVPVKTLQEQILEKLAGMNVLKGNVKIDLGRNTSYVGDIALKRVDLGKVEKDFVLELASEDAGTDGLSANGSTVLDGNLTIEGLNVVVKGVRMALNRVITVVAGVAKVGDTKKEGGSLQYYGTTADDIVTVEAGSGGSASIYTGEGNDRVGLLTTNATKKTEVNTGAGDDTVYAYINGGESLVDTDEGDDRVELYSYGDQPQAKEGEAAKPQVVVKTGAGNDSVQVALSGSAMVDVDTGVNKADVEDDDDVAVFGRYGGGNVSVKTESGSDYVRIAKNFQAPDLVRIVPDVTGVDQLEVTATGEGVIPNPVSVMDVNMGTGNNRVDIDMSVGDTYASVDLSGDTAHRVHLTGAQYITAKSAHGSSQTVLNSGIYGALNVVVQNVTARTGGDKDEKYTGTTKITAGGHVRVKSDTIADVRDNVTSGVSPNAPRSSFTPAIDGFGNLMSTIFMKLLQRGAIKENNAAIKAGMSFLTASEYHIERVNDLSDDAGGSIDSTRTVTTEDGKPKVEGTYTVKQGYTGRVRYRWLEPGQDHYLIAYADLDEENGKFSFTPPAKAKDVFVELLTTKEAGAAGVQAGKDNGGVQNVNDIIEGAGAVISVNATFTPHVYEVKAVDNKDADLNHGKVMLSASSLKKGDTMTITAAPDTDYANANEVIVRY